MINQEVIVNQQLQERIHYENPEFPLARFIDQMDYFADGEFLCHWHPEFELAVILNGSIEYQIDQQIFQLKQGDGIFITSQALHSARQIQPGSVIFNIEFPPSLFHTVGTSFLYQNYFNPTFLRKMGSVAISAEQEEGKEILDRKPNLVFYRASTDNDRGCQYMYDSGIWEFVERWQPLTIEDIANAASISRSECFRCFSDFCQVSPIEYLNRYRLQDAAQKLASTSTSISDISFQCGFSSISYFGKAFRKMYNLSPSEYRQKKRPHSF